jgi:formylglycine-generating enzyme required for sulfatase activity
VQLRYADLLARGEWTPLAASSPDARVVASRWTDGGTTLWAVANRGEAYTGPVGELDVELPAQGIAAFVGAEQLVVAGGEDAAFPAREASRVPAPVVRAGQVPDGMVEVPAAPARTTAVFRRRETGTYGEAPYVDEWKPLPPRLHDLVEVPHATVAAPRFAIGRREVTNAELGRPGDPDAPAAGLDLVEVPHATVAAPRFAIGRREVTNAELGRPGDPDAPAAGLDLAEARAYAASVGARLPTEDEWQLAAEAGLLERAQPLVWNWTESEHTDGRTRFAILKGGSAYAAEGSDWYADGGPHEAARSFKLLLLGGGLAGSSRIGFRLAVDLP